jgi:hypothetical protein
MEYYVWGDMVKKRESVSPALAETALDIREIEEGFSVFGGPPQGQLRFGAEKALVDRQLARERAPAAAAEPVPAKKKIEFIDRITQLRGPNAKTRIEIALLARPQNAELTSQITEEKHDKIGFSRQPIEIRYFSGRELMISDLQLYYETKTGVERKLLPVIRKQGLPVAPYPFEEINKKKPPLIYFEIYNIRAAGIRERLSISYRIAALEKENKNIFQAFAEALSRPD